MIKSYNSSKTKEAKELNKSNITKKMISHFSKLTALLVLIYIIFFSIVYSSVPSANIRSAIIALSGWGLFAGLITTLFYMMLATEEYCGRNV